MKNIVTRILLVAVALPALYSLALFVPFLHHLPIALVVFAFSAGAGLETGLLMEPGVPTGRRVAMALIALAAPLLSWLAAFMPGIRPLPAWLAAFAASTFASLFLSGLWLASPRDPANIALSIRRAGTNSLLSLYPGAMVSALVPALALPEGGRILVWFTAVVFANDGLAWLVGITLGRRRGIFAVSPNKSLEGFVAGMAGSMAGAFAGPLLFPGTVPADWPTLAALGAVCGVAVVGGDLFESALKRAASVKDSGSIIPGRGGFLDSFDSVAFAAPPFLAFLVILGMI